MIQEIINLGMGTIIVYGIAGWQIGSWIGDIVKKIVEKKEKSK